MENSATLIVPPRHLFLDKRPIPPLPPVLPGKVRVEHGSIRDLYDLVGVSVTSVLQVLVHDLNLPSDTLAFVNGVRVSLSYRLRADDFLEFFGEGWKGVGKKVWTEQEFCKFFQITSEDLQAWIGQGLKLRSCLDGSIRITETAADDFFRGQRVESPYLTSEEAAVYLRTTVKGVYSILERGKLKKLSGSRTVLFTRDMLDAYVRGGE